MEKMLWMVCQIQMKLKYIMGGWLVNALFISFRDIDHNFTIHISKK